MSDDWQQQALEAFDQAVSDAITEVTARNDLIALHVLMQAPATREWMWAGFQTEIVSEFENLLKGETK